MCFDLPPKQMGITTTANTKIQKCKNPTYGWSWGWCWRRPLHTCSLLSLCKVQRLSRPHHSVPKSQSTDSSRPRWRWSASWCPPQSSRPPGTTPRPASDWKLKLWISSISSSNHSDGNWGLTKLLDVLEKLFNNKILNLILKRLGQ